MGAERATRNRQLPGKIRSQQLVDRANDVLRDVDGNLKLARRTVYLDHTVTGSLARLACHRREVVVFVGQPRDRPIPHDHLAVADHRPGLGSAGPVDTALPRDRLSKSYLSSRPSLAV